MDRLVLPPPLRELLPPQVKSGCQGALIPKGARVFSAGTRPVWMFYVVSGEVTLERNGRGGDVVVLQRTRQGFISEASLRVSRYHCDAVAVVDTQVIKVEVEALSAALDADPVFASRWIQMLNGEIRRLRLHLERLSMKSIRQRLLHLIETEGKAGRYDTPSGLKTLAGELGVTHEALYRAVARLEADRVLVRDDQGLMLRTT